MNLDCDLQDSNLGGGGGGGGMAHDGMVKMVEWFWIFVHGKSS